MKEKLKENESLCVEIATYILKEAAEAGSCEAGEAALTGIFTAAEVLFFPEGDVILPELEVVIDAGWATICDEVGIEAIGSM
jgi:hypothetical protein